MLGIQGALMSNTPSTLHAMAVMQASCNNNIHPYQACQEGSLAGMHPWPCTYVCISPLFGGVLSKANIAGPRDSAPPLMTTLLSVLTHTAWQHQPPPAGVGARNKWAANGSETSLQ